MSSTAVEIRLNAYYDPKPMAQARSDVESLKRSTDSARGSSLFRSDRAQSAGLLNLSRQTSDIFTQGVSGTSPFTILIQQGPQIADILLSGALSAGKFVGALGALGVGVAGVMGAISAYKQMSEAIDDAATSQEKLNKLMDRRAKDVLSGGIAPGGEEKTISRLMESYQKLEAERNKILNEAPFLAQSENQRPGSGFRGTSFAEMVKGTWIEDALQTKTTTTEDVVGRSQPRLNEIDLQMGLVAKALRRVQSGVASQEGGERIFNENIDPAARKSMQSRIVEEAAKSVSAGAVESMKKLIETMAEKADLLKDSKQKADALNALQNLTNYFNELGAAVDKRAKDEAEFTKKYLELSEEVATRDPAKTAAIGQEAIAARQRIGGMANAPIFSNFQKQTELLRTIATETSRTAANTARQAQTVSPIGAPMGFAEFQANRMTN